MKKILKHKISQPAISRLPLYFRALLDFQQKGIELISSKDMFLKTGIKADQFRKDLSYFGGFGIQGYGYHVKQLTGAISSIMNLNKTHSIVLVGAGNLGSALKKYSGFRKWNFFIDEVYDSDPKKIGRKIEGITIRDVKKFPKKSKAYIGVITVPAEAAQKVADIMVKSGIKAIINFTNSKIITDKNVLVRNVNLVNEFAITTCRLTFQQ